MKTQITITTQISFLADITTANADDWCKLLQKLEERPSPATSAYDLALSSVLGRVVVGEQATMVDVQHACRVCSAVNDEAHKKAFGCEWPSEDLCCCCAETLTSLSDGAQTTAI